MFKFVFEPILWKVSTLDSQHYSRIFPSGLATSHIFCKQRDRDWGVLSQSRPFGKCPPVSSCLVLTKTRREPRPEGKAEGLMAISFRACCDVSNIIFIEIWHKNLWLQVQSGKVYYSQARLKFNCIFGMAAMPFLKTLATFSSH